MTNGEWLEKATSGEKAHYWSRYSCSRHTRAW